MNDELKQLKGSEKRDAFKWAHKNKIDRPFYASDCDLCIVSKEPRGVVAYFDYKGSGEGVTWAEGILYDEWAKTKPVFIIEGKDPENGPFTVSKYKVNDKLELVRELKDWSDFEKWESLLRTEYSALNHQPKENNDTRR